MMELRQLKYFITVAEELNFRRAAERLYIEQPPLSRQIRRLEDELQVELFHRNKRGVTLTPSGKAFLEEAKLTLAQAERAAKAAQRASQPDALSIGFSICIFNRILPELIRAYRQQHPHVGVMLTEIPTEAQIKALLNSEIDVGFIHGPVAHPDLHTFALLTEPLVVALPPNHPLMRQEQIDLQSLADEPFVLCPRAVKPDLYDQAIRLCQQAGFTPNVVQEASPPEVLLGLVASGMGVSLVAAGAEGRHQTGAVYRPLSVFTPVLEVDAVWSRHSSSSSLENFLALLTFCAA
jgi:DNA-binding transcriptional LysR family regulator